MTMFPSIPGTIGVRAYEKKFVRNFVLVQKGRNAKMKVIAARNLKDWTKFTTTNKEKQKRKCSFFIATIMCFPALRTQSRCMLQ